ncbi:Protein phosphatase methylesterase 1 [Schistosoma japonicum]|nr:Protein phosphatase methylesterase 1 [Schistosoma japonicum]
MKHLLTSKLTSLSIFLTVNRVSFHSQSNLLYASTSRRTSSTFIQRLEKYKDKMPLLVFVLIKWWLKIRPLKVEIADLRRRILRNKEGFDTKIHSRTRYFVRFPFLTDEEFASWSVTSDSDRGEGYSWAEFVRSSRSASGCASALSLNESVYPNITITGNNNDTRETTTSITSFDDPNRDHEFGYTHPVSYPKLSYRPGGKQANSEAIVMTSSDPKFKGYGHFRGFISTRVPKRGDLIRSGFANLQSPESRLFGFVMSYGLEAYSHLVIRYSYNFFLIFCYVWQRKFVM